MTDKKREHHHEKKKSAEMKTPDIANENALFSDEAVKDESAAKQSKSETKTVESLEMELQQANDRTLRAYAELDNYRKRINREIEDMQKYAGIDLIRDLLSVWDNMGRALETAEKSHDPETLAEGVKMMYEQFTQILERRHCTRIEALGLPFDPNVHESISITPSADVPAGNVLFESQIGFKLYDRVVRPTQVVLSAGEKKE
ncbi:MAG: nucleotide exchange factor GrpE [Planctomycetaceae bacterium]|jgi:molecular chaperone GrpE|nr:nucleotide exchange factor GrpE [Planctomycetaceae bacterium]